jgi:hypothetical protein
MIRKAAIILVLLMLAIVAWALFTEGSATKIIINGQELTGPLKGMISAGGLIVAAIALFCAAIFLAFVLAGIGLLVLGAFVVGGLVVAALMFPVLLFVLVPLAIVWLFVALVSGGKT